jgi:hypothetical protein
MKDGRTHLAHKAEHAVNLASGALLAITLQPAGDTHTQGQTLEEAQSAARQIDQAEAQEVVGYHSGPALTDLHQQGVRSYIPEPDRSESSRNADRVHPGIVPAKDQIPHIGTNTTCTTSCAAVA